MRTLLDGQPVPDAGSTLGSALDAVRTRVGERIVIEATADGLPVPPEHLDHPPASHPYAAELAFRTADPALVAIEALHEARQTLDELAPRHTEAADLIQSGKTDQALDVLSHLLRGWTELHRTAALVTATARCASPASGQATGAAIEPAAAELAGLLSEIKTALGAQDWPGLSDTLAYDMQPLVERWRTALVAMAQGIKVR